MMDAKAEFHKMWKDVTSSAKEFAALGLNYSGKALEIAGQKIKKAEDSIKAQAVKLHPEKNGKEEPKAEASPPPVEAAK